jgi:hypothetical protein
MELTEWTRKIQQGLMNMPDHVELIAKTSVKNSGCKSGIWRKCDVAMIQNADLGRNGSNSVTGVIEGVESNGDDRERNGP